MVEAKRSMLKDSEEENSSLTPSQDQTLSTKHSLNTQRLLLRAWREDDRVPFAEMMANPEFNRYMPGPFDRAESDAMFNQIQEHLALHGFGLWALELPGEASFIGSVGLTIPRVKMPFSPCVEIGWRIHPSYWNMGYATEGAEASVHHGFQELELDEIVSFTVPENLSSLHVMEKIGMTRDLEGDFEHPGLREGHLLRAHVLYRLKRPETI